MAQGPTSYGVHQARPVAGVGPVPREPGQLPPVLPEGASGAGLWMEACPTARTLG